MRKPRGRRLIVYNGGKWFTRRVKWVVADWTNGMTNYECDKHTGGPFARIEEVPEVKAIILGCYTRACRAIMKFRKAERPDRYGVLLDAVRDHVIDAILNGKPTPPPYEQGKRDGARAASRRAVRVVRKTLGCVTGNAVNAAVSWAISEILRTKRGK